MHRCGVRCNWPDRGQRGDPRDFRRREPRAAGNTAEGFTLLQAWLSQHGVTQLHACMEATNIYWEALATWLYAQGHIVSVVNPARIKGYAQATMQRNKTDKLDSAVIASFCATHHPAAWQPLVLLQPDGQ